MTPHVRNTDHAPMDGGKEPIIKITREIPMVWILGILGLGAATAAGMFYGIIDLGKGQESQGRVQIEMNTKIEAINEKLNQSAVAGAEIRFKLDDLSRRVTALESTVTSQQLKGKP